MGRITQPVNIVATIALFSALVLSVYFIMNPFAFNYHKAFTNLVEGALGEHFVKQVWESNSNREQLPSNG